MLGRGGVGNIMKQAQMMQKRMAQMQQELEERRIEATSGGGMVKAVVSGKQQLISLTIDPKAVDPEDVEMLQDLVVAALSEALKQSQKLAEEEMGKITGGLNIPGMF
jgi:DNA-binding YbaB/EbfC family protein